MPSFVDDFGPFEGHVWLDCAHQGPLPRVAVAAAQQALAEKVAPHLLRDKSFVEVPVQLKSVLASLIGCNADEVILGNSTSYGLNLLVQGLPLKQGDEVLLIDGDFPASVITWLPLRNKGVNVRLHRPTDWPPSPDEIASVIGERTRVLCTSWVFSFFGSAIDIEAIGTVCRDRDVLFVLNGTQGIGARAIDVNAMPVDCLVGCGFKWLCGPVGTGFAWLRPEVLASLNYEQAYWPVHASPVAPAHELRTDVGAERFDVFGTANFLNFTTWTASIEYLIDKGIPAIQDHDEALVQEAVEGLLDDGYRVVSPTKGPSRSTLVVFTHEDPTRNHLIHKQLRSEGVHMSERNQNLRLSPHLYNTSEDIRRVLDLLAKLG